MSGGGGKFGWGGSVTVTVVGTVEGAVWTATVSTATLFTAAGAVAGTLTAFPVIYWLTRRGMVKEPMSGIVGEEKETGGIIRTIPFPKSLWGLLIVTTVLLVGAVAFVLTRVA